MNTNDKRYIKNEKLIRDTFMGILSEKKFSEITIAELCEKCLISKTTFYSHYENIDDLLLKLISELLEGMKPDYRRLIIESSKQSDNALYKITDFTIEYVNKNLSLFKIFFKHDLEIGFSNRFALALKNNSPLDYRNSELEARIVSDFGLMGSIYAIKAWVLNSEKMDAQAVKNLIFPLQSASVVQLCKFGKS